MPAATTASSDEQALLRAIADNPAEDSVRLVYADCVQERGDDERAELIRVQCEIARITRELMDADSPADLSHECGIEGCECKRRGDLRARESDILSRRRAEWSRCPVCKGKPPTFPAQRGEGTFRACTGLCNHTGVLDCDFSRGFPDVVRVPTVGSVLPEKIRCADCGDTKSPHGRQYCYNLKCSSPNLIRERQPTDAARSMLDSYPTIAGVVPVDRVPRRTVSGGGQWLLPDDSGPIDTAAMLPEFLFSKVGRYHKTPELATSALARALRDVLKGKP